MSEMGLSWQVSQWPVILFVSFTSLQLLGSWSKIMAPSPQSWHFTLKKKRNRPSSSMLWTFSALKNFDNSFTLISPSVNRHTTGPCSKRRKRISLAHSNSSPLPNFRPLELGKCFGVLELIPQADDDSNQKEIHLWNWFGSGYFLPRARWSSQPRGWPFVDPNRSRWP